MVQATKTFEPSAKRRFRTEPASATLSTLLRSAAGKRGFAAAEIVTHWRLIVGDRLADCTLPERLRFERGGREGGILEVRVDGPLALEIQHLEPQILDKVNSFCGFRAAGRLKITRGRVPPRKEAPVPLPAIPAAERAEIDRLVATIENDNLREALASLGRSMRARALRDGQR